MDVFDLNEGRVPLIISIPHAGVYIPSYIAEQMTEEGKSIADTDWYVDRLYLEHAKNHDITILKSNVSRYVVDLNRPLDDTPLYPDQKKISVCPDRTFLGKEIYKDSNALEEKEIKQRAQKYWQPYHDELEKQINRIKALHGYALIYDAHSIKSIIPGLFDGELPDLNLGTADGKSCHGEMAKIAFNTAKKSAYSSILNGRFIGGYITRHYGDPDQDIHALQMEIAQHNYMDKDKNDFNPIKAEKLMLTLTKILKSIQDWAMDEYSPSSTTPAQGL